MILRRITTAYLSRSAKRCWLLLCWGLEDQHVYHTLFTPDITYPPEIFRLNVRFLSFFTFALRIFLVFSDGKYHADKRATDRVSEGNKSHVSFSE